jgi:hypothetical protein
MGASFSYKVNEGNFGKKIAIGCTFSKRIVYSFFEA